MWFLIPVLFSGLVGGIIGGVISEALLSEKVKTKIPDAFKYMLHKAAHNNAVDVGIFSSNNNQIDSWTIPAKKVDPKLRMETWYYV
jgi:hypothetical protein